MTVAVTGASGYVGAAVCRALTNRGVAVRALSRRDPLIAGASFVAYDLRRELDPGLLAGVDAVIHTAAETSRGAEPDIDAEIAGLHRLVDAAGAASARFIFVSSQTARPDAPTGYGRLKASAERVVLSRNGAVVRPGQVYGGPEKGLWGTLAALARRAPALPRFIPEPRVQPIHVDDLADALVALACEAQPQNRIYGIADPRPIAFSCFVQLVGIVRFGRRLSLIPVPLTPILWVLRGVGQLGLRPTFARRLASLNDLPELDSAADLAALVPHYRRFPDGVCRGAAPARSLLREGAVLLRYATGGRPSRWLVRSYARALVAMDNGAPLEMPGLVRLMPSSLMLFDQPAARRRAGSRDGLSRRIDLACLLAESSARHVDDFLMSPHRPVRLAQMAQLAVALPLEVLARVADFLGGRLIDRARPSPIRGADDDS
ncbi:NAD-dependent epimerase/dehydratase family protein [Bosea sp. OAE506]|uniref:NAD-dependent epimerase/dehydratase family protein n=1 Tax=Bosea sp. OAE506 TaxID=2663870 RepID=UPI00178B03F5